jgi:hypothetical protein
VLRLVARGLSNSDIARELVVGDATVKTHVARIFAKLRGASGATLGDGFELTSSLPGAIDREEPASRFQQTASLRGSRAVLGNPVPRYQLGAQADREPPISRNRQIRQNILCLAPRPTRRSNSDPHRDAPTLRVVFCGKCDTRARVASSGRFLAAASPRPISSLCRKRSSNSR